MARDDVKEKAVAVDKSAANKTTMGPKEKKLATVGEKVVIEEKEGSGTTNGKDKETITAGDQLIDTWSKKDNL